MTCICVLAMHRSGSSITAGILYALGVHMGDRFREPDAHNETGYWEDLDWRDLNQEILRKCGATWYQPPAVDQLVGIAEQVAPRVATLIARKDAEPLWGMKDPRMCITILLIYPHLPTSTRYVYVRRNEDRVVASLTKRAEQRGYYEPPEHWSSLYHIYNSRAIDFLSTCHKPLFIIEYEQLVSKDDYKLNVKALARFAGLGLCPDFNDRVEAACQLIKPR